MWVGISQSFEGLTRPKGSRRGDSAVLVGAGSSALRHGSSWFPSLRTPTPASIGGPWLLGFWIQTELQHHLLPLLQLADGRLWISAFITAWASSYNKSPFLSLCICPVGSASLEKPRQQVTKSDLKPVHKAGRWFQHDCSALISRCTRGLTSFLGKHFTLASVSLQVNILSGRGAVSSASSQGWSPALWPTTQPA